MRRLLALLAMTALLACRTPSRKQPFDPRSRVSADHFYALVTGPDWGAALLGKTAVDAIELLGVPTDVHVLDHEGHTWMQLVYRFEVAPRGASSAERDAFTRGWKLAPTLLLRDGRIVPEARLPNDPTRCCSALPWRRISPRAVGFIGA